MHRGICVVRLHDLRRSALPAQDAHNRQSPATAPAAPDCCGQRLGNQTGIVSLQPYPQQPRGQQAHGVLPQEGRASDKARGVLEHSSLLGVLLAATGDHGAPYASSQGMAERAGARGDSSWMVTFRGRACVRGRRRLSKVPVQSPPRSVCVCVWCVYSCVVFVCPHPRTQTQTHRRRHTHIHTRTHARTHARTFTQATAAPSATRACGTTAGIPTTSAS